MAITISLCMIVRNEEEVLGRCLDSVAGIFDEIILVDTGSCDNTLAIAKRYTPLVYQFPWQDDFAAARNFAFSKATMEYCMWLDADDVLLPKDHTRLLELKSNLSLDVDVVMLPYCLSLDSDGNPDFHFYRERIVRNSSAYRWQGKVHETITPSGNVVYESAMVLHQKLRVSDPNRNLRILESIKDDPEAFTPRMQYYYGRELWEHQRYQEAIDCLESFLRAENGWIENQTDACLVISHCYKALGQHSAACLPLFRCFLLAQTPRAEWCCALADLFRQDNRLHQAVFWYQAALSIPLPSDSAGFVQKDCYGFLPCIWLCYCYDRLGDLARAESYHQQAARFKPNAPEVLHNQRYFASRHAQA